MGVSDWDRESAAIKEKLAKAYGRSAVVHDSAGPAESITTRSSGFVLNIDSDRKAELKAELQRALQSQHDQTEADLSDTD
jgi:hypothetical protein